MRTIHGTEVRSEGRSREGRKSGVTGRRPWTSRLLLRSGTGRTAFTAGTALPTGATGTPFTALATGPLRAIFIGGDFAIAVLVEFLQRHPGLGQFIGVDGAVFVQVERLDEGVHAALTAGASLASSTARTTALPTRRRWPARGALVVLLGGEEARRCAEGEGEGEEEDRCFHGVVWLLWFGRARRPHRVDAEKCSVRAQRESVVAKPRTVPASPARLLAALRKWFVRIFMDEP